MIDTVPVDGGYAVSLVGTAAATVSTLGEDQPLLQQAFSNLAQAQPRG